jgi:hypothetical protein
MKRNKKVSIYFGLLLVLVTATFARAFDAIMPEVLSFVTVQIEIPLPDGVHSSYGTGCYMSDSNRLYLVTAAHCLFNTQSTNRSELINGMAIAISGNEHKQTNSRVEINLKWLNEQGAIKRHASHDVAVVCLGPINANREPFLASAGFKADFSKLLLKNFDTNICRAFSDVQDGSEAVILGYPRELLSGQVASEVDFGIPLIRKGIVSQKNEVTKKLIIDSGVFGGNSGGPIFTVSYSPEGKLQFRDAGIMTQFVPVATRIFPQDGFTNSVLVFSGYSVAESIDYALELVRQF